MKLRNRKTGEIIDSDKLLTDKFILDLFSRDFDYFNSKLHKIQDEWEECKESKEYWFITWCGNVDKETDDGFDVDKSCKEIGNYFGTKEEAEKAVEKLKAWKRLKDKGFRFEGTNNNKRRTGYFINYYLGKSFNSQEECEQAMKDLDLLFGGKA